MRAERLGSGQSRSRTTHTGGASSLRQAYAERCSDAGTPSGGTMKPYLTVIIAMGWLALSPGTAWPAALAPTVPPAANASSARVAKPEAAMLREYLQELHRDLERRQRNLQGLSVTDLGPEIDRIDHHLRHLELRARALGPGYEDLRAQIRDFRRRWRAVERSGSAGRFVSRIRRAERAVRQPTKHGVPANDACADAMPIGDATVFGTTSGATNDGGASCGVSDSSPDVWFWYTSPAGGRIFANTRGSGYDTVLSVHAGCPGTALNESRCSETFLDRPAAVELVLAAGEEVLLRLSGVTGDSGPWVLEVGPGGAIGGTVKDAATGDPLPWAELRVYPEGGGSLGASTGPSGTYTLDGLSAGSYFVTADSPGYIGGLFADIPCPYRLRSDDRHSSRGQPGSRHRRLRLPT